MTTYDERIPAERRPGVPLIPRQWRVYGPWRPRSEQRAWDGEADAWIDWLDQVERMVGALLPGRWQRAAPPGYRPSRRHRTTFDRLVWPVWSKDIQASTLRDVICGWRREQVSVTPMRRAAEVWLHRSERGDVALTLAWDDAELRGIDTARWLGEPWCRGVDDALDHALRACALLIADWERRLRERAEEVRHDHP